MRSGLDDRTEYGKEEPEQVKLGTQAVELETQDLFGL
jgi:hypothetical protein